MTQRHFTRRDIEAFFNTNWPQFETEHTSFELQAIKVLPNVTPPMWQITYSIVGKTHTRYHDVLVGEFGDESAPWLNVVGMVDLPEGCTTPEEEDAEMARQLAEFRTQHAGE